MINMSNIIRFNILAGLFSLIPFLSGCTNHEEEPPIITPAGINTVFLYNNSVRDINDYITLKLSNKKLTFGWHYETDRKVEYSWVNIGKSNSVADIKTITQAGWIGVNTIPLLLSDVNNESHNESSTLSQGETCIIQSTEILTDPPHWPQYYAQVLYTAIKFVKFTEHHTEGYLNFDDRYDFETKTMDNPLKLRHIKREVSSAGGLVAFELKEPASFKIIRLPDWIEIQNIDQSTITLNVSSNSLNNSRVGEIIIGDDIMSENFITLKVFQEAGN